jgi:biotin operon repressor
MDFGDGARAVSHFQRAIAIAEAGGQTDVQACLESHLALAYLGSGRLEEADRLSAGAVATLDAMGSFNCTKAVSFARYRIVAAVESPDAARSHLERTHRLLMAQAAKIGDPALRDAFLHNVRLNRSILLAHRLGRAPSPVRYTRVWLPCATAPTGRPLADDETLDVIWTVAAPEDGEIEGKVDRRRCRVLRLLQEAEDQGGGATVEALADALAVSARTIKRDLAALRDAGCEVSTRGSRRA